MRVQREQLNTNHSYYFEILDDIRRSDIPTVQLLRSLARAPVPGVLASVQHVLSSLLVVDNSRLPVDTEEIVQITGLVDAVAGGLS